jgi:Flp pilus assembly protein TadG
MMRHPLSRALCLTRDCRASAAVEFALVTPVFLALAFGAYDLGNYFLSEHVVVKAVRDGARYAARRGFSEYSCSALTVSPDVIDKTRNIVRTGTIASGADPRLNGWSDVTTITVSLTCDTSNSYSGIYKGITTGVPVVTVTAAVSYSSLFKKFGITTSSITLNAASQAAVMGV